MFVSAFSFESVERRFFIMFCEKLGDNTSGQKFARFNKSFEMMQWGLSKARSGTIGFKMAARQRIVINVPGAHQQAGMNETSIK